MCQKFVKNGTTGEASSFPFVSGCLSTSCWLLYGFLIEDKSLIMVNAVGATLFLSYSIIFFLYSIKKVKCLLGNVTFIFVTTEISVVVNNITSISWVSISVYMCHHLFAICIKQRRCQTSNGIVMLFYNCDVFCCPINILDACYQSEKFREFAISNNSKHFCCFNSVVLIWCIAEWHICTGNILTLEIMNIKLILKFVDSKLSGLCSVRISTYSVLYLSQQTHKS